MKEKVGWLAEHGKREEAEKLERHIVELMERRERGVLLFSQWGVMGLLCPLVVWPFGIGLGWYLSAVVTPVAFGWSFPLRIEMTPYLSLVALSIAALVIAVALPSLRLLRVSPAVMLKEQGV